VLVQLLLHIAEPFDTLISERGGFFVRSEQLRICRIELLQAESHSVSYAIKSQ